MKELSYLFLGLGAFLLSSCSQEDVFDPTLSGGESTVTFTINAPQDIQSRAFADGATANNLQYQLYRQIKDADTGETKYEWIDDEAYYFKKNTANFEKSAVLSFQLMKGESYRLVAVARKVGTYSVSFSKNSATISRGNMSSTFKDEAGDVFYATEDFTVGEVLSGTVELKRAVAQINIGTNDYEKAKKQGFSGLKNVVINVPSYMNLNLMTGKVSSQTQGSGYGGNSEIWDSGEAYPKEGYDYFALHYCLVSDEAATYDVTIAYTIVKEDGSSAPRETKVIGSVPLQRNRRTNIYGALITSTTDFKVEVDDEFGTPDLESDPFMIALATGGSGSLNSDLTVAKQKEVKNTSVVDLNGNTITSNIKTSTTTNQSVPIYVTSGGNLTIKGDAEGSKMFASAEYDSHLVGVGNGGTLTIESGTFEAEKDGEVIYIGAGGGTVYIKGGVFKNGNSGSSSQNFLLNCLDTEYKNGTAKFVITGGSFYNFDPSHSTVDINPNANWVPEGYKVESRQEGNDTIYTVVPEN